jgi:cytochrome b
MVNNQQTPKESTEHIKYTRVWDTFVRLFHWTIVGLVITSLISGEFELDIHPYSGYLIFALVSLRIIWGFVGSRHALFKNFIHSPSHVIRYLKDMVTGNPKRFLGHNPAGGVMVLALLITLATTTLSGMKLYAVEEGEGPFASNIQHSLLKQAYADSDSDSEYKNVHQQKPEQDDASEEFWKEVHETSIGILMLLILLHVLGVVLASKQHKENLIKAMFTGDKKNNQV